MDNAKSGILSKVLYNRLQQAERLAGNFPFSIDDYIRLHPNDYQRGSNFVDQITVGKEKEARKRLRDEILKYIEDGKITVITQSGNIKPDQSFVRELMHIANDYSGIEKLYGSMAFAPKNGWALHGAVQKIATKNLGDKIIATKMPIWRYVEGKLVTGHIDFLILSGNTLYVVDYKPDKTGYVEKDPDDPGSIRKNFIQIVPQVAAYAKILKLSYGIDLKVECVSFNKDYAYVFDDSLLGDIEQFMDDEGISDRKIWMDYIY